MPAKTIATFLAAPPDGRGSSTALRYFEDGRWKSADASTLARSVRELAAGLDDLGVELGGRVAVLAPATPGALVADLAVQSMGAASIPIDPGLRSVQLARLLRRTEPRQIFVCDPIQLDRVLELRPELPSLELVVLLASHDGDEVAAATHVETICARGSGRLRTDPNLFEQLRGRVSPQTPACILPSETTGEPSDFAPSHEQLVHAAEALGGALSIDSRDSVLAALPGSRPSQRALKLLCLSRGAEFVFARSEDGSIEVDLLETQPTVLLADSGWLERFAERVRATLRARGVPLRRLHERCLALGEERTLADLAGDPPAPRPWKLRVADATVLGAYRRKLVGPRLRRIVSLGKPLSDDCCKLLAALGVAAFEGEDCSATSGLLALNTPLAFRRGTLGRLLPGIEGRLEGVELLVRGPSGSEWLPSGRRLQIDPEGWVVLPH